MSQDNECRCVTVHCAVHGAAEQVLEALKELLERVGSDEYHDDAFYRARKQARQAIAKAEGR